MRFSHHVTENSNEKFTQDSINWKYKFIYVVLVSKDDFYKKKW